MIVADSDVLIDALRGRDPVRSRVALELQTGRLATTSVSVFELRSGARTARERGQVDALLEALTLIAFDGPAAESAAAIRVELESRGKGLAMADYLIAGICVSRSAMLMTRNRAHFERVPGLVLSGAWRGEDPSEP
jgi:predicted nucleic acid-binding protein